MKPKTEASEAKAFIEWCDLHPLIKGLMVHIPNERKCSKQYGSMLKKMGVRKGFPDFFLPLHTIGGIEKIKYTAGLFIELKRDRSRIASLEQLDWINRLRLKGYSAHVAYGCDHAIQIVEEYLG